MESLSDAGLPPTLSMLSNLFAWVLVLLAGFVALSNWVFLAQNNRNAREVSGRHVSMVFLVAQILASLAWVVAPGDERAWISSWIYGLVAVVDPAFLLLCAWPFALLRRRRRTRQSGTDL